MSLTSPSPCNCIVVDVSCPGQAWVAGWVTVNQLQGSTASITWTRFVFRVTAPLRGWKEVMQSFQRVCVCVGGGCCWFTPLCSRKTRPLAWHQRPLSKCTRKHVSQTRGCIRGRLVDFRCSTGQTGKAQKGSYRRNKQPHCLTYLAVKLIH